MDDLVSVFYLMTVVSWFVILADWFMGFDVLLPKIALVWALAIAFVVLLRALARTIARQSPLYLQRAIVSLVGPRPLILEEDSHIEAWGRKRLDLEPGITGPWQVLGGSSIPFEEMVRLDYLYITNWSLYDDVKWLWKTIPNLVNGRHAY